MVRALKLMWELARDEQLPTDLIESAVLAHFTMIELIPNSDDFRRDYILLCIDEIRANSGR